MKKFLVVFSLVLGLLMVQSCSAASFVRDLLVSVGAVTPTAEELRSKRIEMRKSDLIFMVTTAKIGDFNRWLAGCISRHELALADLVHVHYSSDSMNLLHVAAGADEDSGQKVAWLLACGGFLPIINAKTNDKLEHTALHIAAIHTNEVVIRELLNRGADVIVKNAEGRTPHEAMLACARYGREAFDRMARCTRLFDLHEVGAAERRVYVHRRGAIAGTASGADVLGDALRAPSSLRPLSQASADRQDERGHDGGGGVIDPGSDDRAGRGKKRGASEVPDSAPGASKTRAE